MQNKQAEWTESKLMHFFAIYLNYIFWFGYYRQKKQTHQFWSHLFQSLTGAIKNKRFMLLKQLDSQTIKKNQRGDRV